MGRYIDQYWQSNLNAAAKRDRRSGPYRAYLPDFLESMPSVDTTVAQEVAALEKKIRELSTDDASGLESLSRFLIHSEAVASSRIEGLVVGAKKLAIEELKETAPHRHGKYSDVIRNIRALRHAIDEYRDVPTIRFDDIIHLHELLVDNEELHGIRQSQNWIGGNSYHPLDAEYVPPPAEHLEKYLVDFVDYLNGAAHGALIQAALIHAQFETLHPFADGNGRIGRALIHLVLARRGLTPNALLPISVVLQTRPRAYVEGLSAFRSPTERAGGINTWVKIFISACNVAVRQAEEFSLELNELRQSWRTMHEDSIRDGRSRAIRQDSASYRLRENLANIPVFTTASVKEELKCSAPAAINAIEQLADAGIIFPISITRDLRGWYQPDIFSLITDRERALASTEWSPDPLISATE